MKTEELIMNALNILRKRKEIVTAKSLAEYVLNMYGITLDLSLIGYYFNKNHIKRKHTNFGNVVVDDDNESGVVNIKSFYRDRKHPSDKITKKINIMYSGNAKLHLYEPSHKKIYKVVDTSGYLEPIEHTNSISNELQYMMESKGLHVYKIYLPSDTLSKDISGIPVKMKEIIHISRGEPYIISISFVGNENDISYKENFIKSKLKEWDIRIEKKKCATYCTYEETE